MIMFIDTIKVFLFYEYIQLTFTHVSDCYLIKFCSQYCCRKGLCILNCIRCCYLFFKNIRTRCFGYWYVF